MAWTTHIGMVGTDPLSCCCDRVFVTVVGEDVAHMAVLAGTDLQSQHAACFQPWFAVTPSQREQAQAGTIAMLWMFAFFEYARDGNGGGRTDGFTPIDQPLRGPLHVRSVCSRHVLLHSAEVAGPAVVSMAGDALPTVENLDRSRDNTRLQHLADPSVRDAV